MENEGAATNAAEETAAKPADEFKGKYMGALARMAKAIRYFPGVEGWFSRMNAYVRRRSGGKVIVVNPIVETGMVNFSVPSDPWALLFGAEIASTYVQPYVCIQKDAGAETENLDLDYIKVAWER